MSTDRDLNDILSGTRKTKQEENDAAVVKGGTACAVILVVPVIYTLVILFAWNVGIEPFFKTLGNISFWQALGLTVGFSVVLSLLLGLVGAARGDKL